MKDNKTSDLTAKYLAQLHHGAKPSIQKNAKELRTRETKAEEKLWSLLRNRQFRGKKFRRQHPIANFIVDFYCNESKLAIELDGNYHIQPEAMRYDRARSAVLNEIGITVLRFWNEEVINESSKVLEKISLHLY